MSIQQELLQKYGDALSEGLKKSIPKATGKTASKIFAQAEETAVDVNGPEHIFALEYGRGPTKSSSKSDPTLFEAIKEWALAKSIINDESKESLSIVGAITRKIHNEGTLLYREGGNSGVITNVINQVSMQSLLTELSILKLEEYSSEVIRELKTLN